MLEPIKHQFKRKAEILVREGAHLISKSPVVVIAKNGAGTKIDIKTAASYHGQIARDAAGNVDLIAEMSRHPDALWVRVKAIEADAPNDNGDYFSREEIIKSYHTFEGVPVFTNHENNKVEMAKGKVVKAEWDDREGAVYCTMYIDRAANASLCRAIEEGYVTDVSMGTQVDYSTCSVCEKKAFTAEDYCPHVKTMKGRPVDGKKVFEKNFGLKFIEISVVTDGACKDCTIREVLDPQDYLMRVAAAVETYNKSLTKTAQMTKDGGQAEIQKLNQAMDLLEDVSRTMLAQRQYIDLEFLNKVVEVLADLQHVNDELVDQGYGRMGDPSQQGIGVPPIGENSVPPMQEQGGQGANTQTAPATSTVGVGSVTEPATASSEGRILVSSRIKDLHERVTKIYEEARLSSSGGVSVDKEKANQTVAKLATIWANPTVKNYEGEFREGDFKVVFSGDEIIGLRGGTKVASLKRNDLDSDLKQELKDNPRVCAGHLLDGLKTQFASAAPIEKTAGYAPTDTREQQEMTMELQLKTQKLPLHPRENEIRQSTTEDQLRKKRDGYDYHERQDKSRDQITEAQLREGEYHGYEYHKVQDDPRDEIMELQLRNEKWKGNVTPATSDREWAAGVSDQKQQITEGQLNDWKDSDKRHLPDMITEKQLEDDSENWGRRIASKEDAKKAVTAGFSALAKTAVATGATPDELIDAISDFTSSPRNMMAAQRAVTSLANARHKAQRQAMLNRSKFHGTGKLATAGEIADFMLGSFADEGMSGTVALETLEIISNQKNSFKQISDAITTAKASESKPVKTASSKDFLREAIAESTRDEIRITLEKTAVKADPKDAEKFAEAAYEAATKIAETSGIKITDKIHVAEKNGKIEVAMYGMKAEAKVEEAKAEAPKAEAAPAPAEKTASAEDLKARKEARREVVAQFGGAAPGGDAAGGAPGGMPGAGGGTTLPQGPAAADPTAGIPPVAGLGSPDAGDEEGELTGEAMPPGSICPVCGSEDVEIRHGEFTCNECGAAGDFEVEIHIREYPGVIEDTEPKNDEGLGGGEEMGGIGDMGGGAGMELGAAPGGAPGAEAPGVGMQQAFVITPNMVKIAGNKPIGSYCPHCGSSKVVVALKKGSGKGHCENCNDDYEVETLIDTANKNLVGKIRWEDRKSKALANKLVRQFRQAKRAEKELLEKKAMLDSALRKSGQLAKFVNAGAEGKAAIIAGLADKGLLKKGA